MSKKAKKSVSLPVHIPVPVVSDEEREMKWLREAIGNAETKKEKAISDPNVIVTPGELRRLDIWKRRLARLEKYA